MMNAEDAMGLQEDLARIGRQPGPRWEPLRAPDESGNTLAVAIAAQRAQQQAQQRAAHERLNNAMYERNEIAAVSRAARETIDLLAAELAKVTGTPSTEAIQQARELLSRRFDVQLEDALARKSVARDIRSIPSEIGKFEWYVPAP